MGLNKDQWDKISNTFRDVYTSKNEEYGDADLKIMGRSLQLAMNLVNEKDGIEAAIQFYLLGKIARAISANKRGEPASDDTIMDIAIYGMMLAGTRDMELTTEQPNLSARFRVNDRDPWTYLGGEGR